MSPLSQWMRVSEICQLVGLKKIATGFIDHVFQYLEAKKTIYFSTCHNNSTVNNVAILIEFSIEQFEIDP